MCGAVRSEDKRDAQHVPRSKFIAIIVNGQQRFTFPGTAPTDSNSREVRVRSGKDTMRCGVAPVSKSIKTIDFRGELVLLGTGTSVGVPAVGCACPVCASDDWRNRRTRSSIAVGLPEGNLLVDTTPDLRNQMLREGIGVMHAALFTHEHADHVMGLDDVRLFPFYLGHAFPIYCEPPVEDRIRRSFDYAFDAREVTHAGARPDLAIQRISTEPFDLLGTQVIPIRLKHGACDVLGFRFGNLAYCTDASEIPEESWPLLEGLDVLILNALRRRPHPTHLSLDQAVAIAEQLQPKRTLFTHISHDLEHQATCSALPDGMDLAYDGQRVTLPIVG